MALVAVVQLVQHSFSHQVTDQVGRDAHGLAGQGFASAAVAEARARLVAALNTPGADAFTAARAPLTPNPNPIPLKIAAADLPRVAARMSDVAGANYSLDSVAAVLTPRGGLTTATALEYEGDLAVQASVRSNLDRGDARTVSSSWGVRVVSVAPAGSLRATNILIRHPDRVVGGRWAVPSICKTFVDTDLPGLIQQVQTSISGLEAQKSSSPDPGSIDQIEAGLKPLVQGDGGGRLGKDLARVADPFHQLAPLPNSRADYMFITSAAAVGLGELNLQPDFDALMTRHRTLKAEEDQLANQIRSSPNQATMQRYAEVLGLLGDLMADATARYVRFRRAFPVVTKGTPVYDAVAASYELLSPTSRFPGAPQEPGFDLRVCAVIDESLVTGPLDAAVTQLFRSAGGGAPAVQGVVLVRNPTRPLSLTGTFSGRFTLVVTGALTLDGIKKSDPTDAFTFVQMASAATALNLSGQLEATVIAPGDNLHIASGTQILGGLFLEDVVDSAKIDPQVGGPERSTRDTARAALTADQLRCVVVSPWVRSTHSSHGAN